MAGMSKAPRYYYRSAKVERPELKELWDKKLYEAHFVQDDVVPPEHPMNFDKEGDDIVLGADSSKGNVLILNIIQYYDSGKNRKGAIADTYNMKRLWKQLGYDDVESIDDRQYKHYFTKVEVFKILEKFVNKCIDQKAKPESIVVFIGAHGRNQEITMPDGTTGMNIKKDIILEMAEYAKGRKKSKYWANIPKIFIIQACRDKRELKGDNEKLTDNTFVCYSTLADDGSYRAEYVECLTKVILNNAYKKDFKAMLELTEDEVWDKVIKKPKGDTQQPTYDETFGEYKLYFEIKPRNDAAFKNTTATGTEQKQNTLVESMVEKQKNHIKDVLSRLIKTVTWNAVLMAEFGKFLDDADVTMIKVEKNPHEKTELFFDFLKRKLEGQPDAYKSVIEAFDAACQRGVGNILREVYEK